jgi:hypothetical protein
MNLFQKYVDLHGPPLPTSKSEKTLISESLLSLTLRVELSTLQTLEKRELSLPPSTTIAAIKSHIFRTYNTGVTSLELFANLKGSGIPFLEKMENDQWTIHDIGLSSGDEIIVRSS